MKPDYNKAIEDLTAGVERLVRQVEAETGVVVKRLTVEQSLVIRGIDGRRPGRVETEGLLYAANSSFGKVAFGGE